MEQIQAELADMRTKMTNQMTQFMEVITTMTRNQEELRALVEQPRVARAGGELMFEDISVGQPRPNVDMNVNGQQPNGVHNFTDTPFMHGNNVQFPPPPGARLIAGGVRGHQNERGHQGFDLDNHDDQYSMHSVDLGIPAEDRKYRMLEERLKAVEGQGVLGMDITDLGMVPGVRVPPKFKVPVFDKYTGATCPRTHVKSYYRKMSVYSEDERMLMHFFQDSLSGGPLEWYMQLERTYIRNWRDLVEAFVKQY